MGDPRDISANIYFGEENKCYLCGYDINDENWKSVPGNSHIFGVIYELEHWVVLVVDSINQRGRRTLTCGRKCPILCALLDQSYDGVPSYYRGHFYSIDAEDIVGGGLEIWIQKSRLKKTQENYKRE